MLMVPTELRPSLIHGVGCFLLTPIKQGELIWRFDARFDRVFTKAELGSLPQAARSFIEIHAPWHRESGLWVLSGDNARYFNHSDHPTAQSAGFGCFADDVAARDLAAGTELTCNYHHFYDNTDVIARMGLVEA